MNDDRRIDKLTDLLFEEVPFSQANANAKEAIREALQTKYLEFAEHNPSSEAFELLMKQYGSLEQASALAGISAKIFEHGDHVYSAERVKKEFRGVRWRIYGLALLLTLVFEELFFFLYNIVNHFYGTSVYLAIVTAAVLLLCGRLYRRLKERTKGFLADACDGEAYRYLQGFSDQYAKRNLHAIALFGAVFAMLVVSEVIFYFSGNSKPAELFENLNANLRVVQIPLYLLWKNHFCLSLLEEKIGLPPKDKYRRHEAGMWIFTIGYWTLAVAGIFLFGGKFMYPGNLFVGCLVVFVLLVLLYDLLLRKRVVNRNIVVNKKRLIIASVVVLVIGGGSILRRDTWYTQPYINSVPTLKQRENAISYNEETGTYSITASGEDFKILHLTDIHLGGSLFSYRKDMKALEACFAEIEATRPDLVVVTGELCFPLGIMSLSLNNTSSVQQFSAFMRNLGIPWCFTYGNHDTESLASANKETLDAVYQSLSYKTSGTLLYPYVQPEISGRNNQVIEIYNADGTLNNALFLIDSNAYTGEGINVYDYIHDDQVDWYASEVERLNAKEGRTISSMAFFHIPLQQYRTAYELYEAGSDEVTYYFGINGETMIDKVCCSDYPSELFDRMKELGSTKGVFCGHDHYNNMSLEYQGIRLTYGMSIDYLAMPGIEKDTAQRGGELITLHADNSWDVVQIPLTSITQGK